MKSEKIKLVLIGGGGHCKSCIEVIESTNLYQIVGILDLPTERGKYICGYKVIGDDNDYLKYKELNCSFVITAGQIKSFGLRKRIFDSLKGIEAKIEIIISSSATVSKHAEIGEGTVIFHHCVVNAGSNIGTNCIINTGSIIEHDANIGNNCHISTGAVINGDVNIGMNSFVGSNSCISNGLTIADESIIGAGSTVIKDIETGGTYAGSPAKKI